MSTSIPSSYETARSRRNGKRRAVATSVGTEPPRGFAAPGAARAAAPLFGLTGCVREKRTLQQGYDKTFLSSGLAPKVVMLGAADGRGRASHVIRANEHGAGLAWGSARIPSYHVLSSFQALSLPDENAQQYKAFAFSKQYFPHVAWLPYT